MPQKNIRAITLDLDDTLWPIAPTLVAAEQRAQDWLMQHAAEVASAWTHHQLQALRMKLYTSNPDLRFDLLHLRRLALQHAFTDRGFSPEEASDIIESTLEVFMIARNEVAFYPEVLPCLERLAQRYPLVAITNGNADLKTIGIAHLFRATVAGHEHGTLKPDAELFHIACRKLDCSPAEVVHVGDDPDLDVRGAKNAGLHAVWINRGNQQWQGEDVPPMINTLEDIEHWVGGSS